jgi:hypothetical protein
MVITFQLILDKCVYKNPYNKAVITRFCVNNFTRFVEAHFRAHSQSHARARFVEKSSLDVILTA